MIVTVLEAGHPPCVHRVEGVDVVVGRAPGCDIVVDRPFVSGRHLRLLGGVVAHDLGSTNGTFLDGELLDRPQWIGGRRMTLGGDEVELVVEADEGAAPAPLPERDDPTTAPIQLMESAMELAGPTPPPPPAPAPPPSRPMPRVRPVVEPREGESALLVELIASDAKNHAPRLDASLTDFFELEAFRFLRDVETIVSRIAGELVGRSTNETILPSSADNVMRLLGDVLAEPDDRAHRERFLAHLAELRRWLVESLSAYQRASVRLVEDLRSSLGVLELSRAEPIPGLQRALGLQDMVLWKRAQARLQDLTPDVIAERLDELAREAAREALES